MAAPDHAQRLSRDSSCTGEGVHTCPCGTLIRRRCPFGVNQTDRSLPRLRFFPNLQAAN